MKTKQPTTLDELPCAECFTYHEKRTVFIEDVRAMLELRRIIGKEGKACKD